LKFTPGFIRGGSRGSSRGGPRGGNHGGSKWGHYDSRSRGYAGYSGYWFLPWWYPSVASFFCLYRKKIAVFLLKKPIKSSVNNFFGCRGVRGWSSAHHHNKRRRRRNLPFAIWNGPHGILRGVEEADSWKKYKIKNLMALSFKLPFACTKLYILEVVDSSCHALPMEL
jgi:hypothetical protein